MKYSFLNILTLTGCLMAMNPGKYDGFSLGIKTGLDHASCIDQISEVKNHRVLGYGHKNKVSYKKTGAILGLQAEYGNYFTDKHYYGLEFAFVKGFTNIKGSNYFKFNQQVSYKPKYTYQMNVKFGRHVDSVLIYAKTGFALLKRTSSISYELPQKIIASKTGFVRGMLFGMGVTVPLNDRMHGSVEVNHVRYHKEQIRFKEGIDISQRFKNHTLTFNVAYRI